MATASPAWPAWPWRSGRRPTLGVASSRGTGDLLRAALDAGARSITLGLGGSATTDGGSGMLVALGARLLDESGEELPPGGAALARLARIDVERPGPAAGRGRDDRRQRRDQHPRAARPARPPPTARRRAATSGRSRSWIARCCTGAGPSSRRPGARSPTSPGPERPAARPRPCSASPTRSSGRASRWWPSAVGLADLLDRGRPGHHRRGPGRRADAVRQGGDGRGGPGARQRHAGHPAVRRPGAGRRRAGCVGRVRGRAADRRPTDAPGRLDARHRAPAGQRRRAAWRTPLQVGLLLAEPSA